MSGRVIGAIGLTGALAALAVPGAAATPRFSCTVTGEKMLSPAMTSNAVCARFRAAAAAAISRMAESDWMRVDVRFAKPGVASAKLTEARNGRTVAHPEISIAVSDRPLDATTVEMLAAELAKTMAINPKRR